MERKTVDSRSRLRRGFGNTVALLLVSACLLGCLAVPAAGPHPDSGNKFYLLDIKLPESALSMSGTHDRVLSGVHNIVRALPYNGLAGIHAFKVLGESRLAVIIRTRNMTTDSRLHVESVVAAIEDLGTTVRTTPVCSFEAWAENLIGDTLPVAEVHLMTRGKAVPLDYTNVYRAEIMFSSRGLSKSAYMNMLRDFTINILKARAANRFRFSAFKVVGNLPASFELYVSERPSVFERYTLSDLLPQLNSGSIKINTDEVVKLQDLVFPLHMPTLVFSHLVHGI